MNFLLTGRQRSRTHKAILAGVLTTFLLGGSGCASKWILSEENPSYSPHWLDQWDNERVRHAATITGFRETGTSIPNLLGRLAFGRTTGGSITRPVAVAAGLDGRLAVADAGCACIHLFVPSQKQYRRIHQAGDKILQSPVSVVFDDESRLYVSDSSQGRIAVFDRNGEYVSSIRGPENELLERPTGLSFCPHRKLLYAVDTVRNRINAFTTKGDLVFSFGTRGADPGQFNFPTHITHGPDGKLYVTDTMNFRVQVFDQTGTFVASFGRHGNGSGDFSMPKGLAVDSAGAVYVVDALFDNIQLFDLDGNFLFTIGGRGTGHGEFWLPSGVFLDNTRLYVCDTFNQRIQIFDVMRNLRD